MTVQTLTAPTLAAGTGLVRRLLGLFWPARPAPDPVTEAERRAFVQEMLSRCPEAVDGEHGLQALMTLYPSEF